MDLGTVTILVIIGLAAGVLGGMIGVGGGIIIIPVDTLKRVFGIFLLLMGLQMVFGK